MKIVVVHNFYQQPGGEDQVFSDETSLLESHGHAVIRHTADNDEIARLSWLSIAGKTLWNRSAHRALHERVCDERADVVHFHNTFPLLSPAVYDAARSAGATVVQTLHNYRLICPAGTFLRDGRPCEDCLGRAVPWPAIVHECYRRSRPASAVVTAMLAMHRARGTYQTDVDAYIALSEFAREKFISAGLPAGRIVVKPNFVSPDPGTGNGAGGYVLFVGRLNQSKGVHTLLSAWKKLDVQLQLKILGDGEMAGEVRAAAGNDARIEYLGQRPQQEVFNLVGEATALVFPSIWYEGQPKTILEAFARGTPVIASKIGSAAELVADGQSGLHFSPGNAEQLAIAARRCVTEPEIFQNMRAAARAQFERCHTAVANYRMLMNIYESARQGRNNAECRVQSAE